MKRLYILILAFLMLAGAADAETPAQTTLGKGDVLRGQFTETRNMQGFNAPMVSQGNFTVAPGYGLIWDTRQPFAITTVITPAGLTQNIDGAKVTDLPTGRLPFLLHLYDALSGALAGDWQTLDKDFIVTRADTGKTWRIELKPRQAGNAAMPFETITVTGSTFAENVHMAKTGGDSENIAFQNQSVSHGAPDAAETAAFGVPNP